MTVSDLIEAIQTSKDWFKLTFVKSNGQKVTRNCRKIVKHTDSENKPTKGSKFKYSLRDTWSFLLEMEGIDQPRTVKIFGILAFNNCENIVF